VDVLVTGTTGYTGSGIADVLVVAGHRVSGLARPDESARKLEERDIRAVRGDITDAESLREAARGVEAVVHAALMHPLERCGSIASCDALSSLSGSTRSEYSGPGSPSG
jgi:uncharacterized protein YbjT (DUF2867 family)